MHGFLTLLLYQDSTECNTTWEACISPSANVKIWGGKKLVQLQAFLATLFTEYHFYWKEWLIDIWLFRFVCLAHMFLKKQRVSMCHFKENDSFFSSDRIWAFKGKLEFLKIWIHHHELDSFPVVNIATNAIRNYFNKFNFQNIVQWKVSTFAISAYLNEPIFFKWAKYEVTVLHG